MHHYGIDRVKLMSRWAELPKVLFRISPAKHAGRKDRLQKCRILPPVCPELDKPVAVSWSRISHSDRESEAYVRLRTWHDQIRIAVPLTLYLSAIS